jgi:thiol-disulfide isomerase/thioredoxin
MFNLQGQGHHNKSTYEGVDQSHSQYLQQAFTTVLAKQIVDNEDVLRDAMQQQVEHREEEAIRRGNQKKQSGDDSDSSDISFSDDDEMLDRLQLQRKQQLVSQNNEITTLKAKGHGSYDLIVQSEFLPIVTDAAHQNCIIHFFHRDFDRCKIVDKHLTLLAPRYLPVKFARLDAEKTPFFVEKLKIAVLPTVVCFKDGKVVDRLTGFEELGNKDDFTTEEFETRLKKSGVMTQLKCHVNAADRLSEDEKRNQNGGRVFSIGGKFGPTFDDDHAGELE